LLQQYAAQSMHVPQRSNIGSGIIWRGDRQFHCRYRLFLQRDPVVR